MRRLWLLSVVVLGVGCQSYCGRFGCGSWGPPSCLPPCAEAPACPPAPCPAPVEEKITQIPPAPKVVEQPKPQVVEKKEVSSNSSAIAQEVMLVPRTVYVPFVAQTPIAPVRLAGLTGGSVVTERRETLSESRAAAETAAAPGPSRESLAAADALAAMGKSLEALNKRLDELQKKLPQADEGPAMIPPGCPLPTLPSSPGCRVLPGCKDR